MSISVVCPSCEKKLKAKDELAGKRVKCPGCGHGILVPCMVPAAEVQIDPVKMFLHAVEESDVDEIARLLPVQNLTLVESPEFSIEGQHAALTAEVDDFQVLVAFTSEEYVRAFAKAMPDMLDAEGSLPVFVVSGADFLENLPEGCGVLLNAEHGDSMVLPPDLMAEVKRVVSELNSPETQARNERAESIRQESLEYLKTRGFQAADWLPLSDVERDVRSLDEIAGRLMGLATVFAWVSAPSDAVTSEHVREYIKKNRLRHSLTADEAKILGTPRSEARKEYIDSIGWRLENMWPLAWILGFDAEPTIAASQIDDEITNAILFDLLGGLKKDRDELVRNCHPRSVEEVIALEDRFYCAHNAVRSAQLGNDTVPEDFHPVAHGGAVHERRHSLTWSLSVGTAWDDTDLST